MEEMRFVRLHNGNVSMLRDRRLLESVMGEKHCKECGIIDMGSRMIKGEGI